MFFGDVHAFVFELGDIVFHRLFDVCFWRTEHFKDDAGVNRLLFHGEDNGEGVIYKSIRSKFPSEAGLLQGVTIC